MAILRRIAGLDQPKISPHDFVAALAEYKRGAVNKAQVVAAFGLSQTEATNLDQFLTNMGDNSITRELVADVTCLLESGHYTIAVAKTRLGITTD